jgi:hypothetical protein
VKYTGYEVHHYAVIRAYVRNVQDFDNLNSKWEIKHAEISAGFLCNNQNCDGITLVQIPQL